MKAQCYRYKGTLKPVRQQQQDRTVLALNVSSENLLFRDPVLLCRYAVSVYFVFRQSHPIRVLTASPRMHSIGEEAIAHRPGVAPLFFAYFDIWKGA